MAWSPPAWQRRNRLGWTPRRLPPFQSPPTPLRHPSQASARLLPGVSIKSPELNALHISQIQGMVNLNGERSKARRPGSSHLRQHEREESPLSFSFLCKFSDKSDVAPRRHPES